MYPRKQQVQTIILILILIVSMIIPSVIAEQKKIVESSEKYAVIVVGRYAGVIKHIMPKHFQQYYTWYLNAAAMTYTMLTEKYGYTDENIYLLVTLRERYSVPDSFYSDWIDAPSTKNDLKQVLDEFKPGGSIWSDADDFFFFTFIDHGIDENEKDNGKYAHDTFFGLPYEFESIHDLIQYFVLRKDQERFRVYDFELAEYIENIHAGKKVFLLQPCYSGGFINDLSGINHIICSSSKEDEAATASWIEPFIRGLNGEADANGDDLISMLEAYEFAARRVAEDTRAEHPLLDDNDDGVGHHFSDTGYDPSRPNYDGYVAARTFL